MSGEISYCPMTGASCSYDSQEIKPNSFFLIQPFDNNKHDREKAIEYALKKLYGKGRYQLKKSDSHVHLQGSYCDICKKIRSCQICIADISGEIFKVLIETEMKDRVFLRPNIAFELGLAYGFNKPSLILFKKLINTSKIPSDLDFIRYIDITAENWPMVSQKLLDRLRDNEPIRAIISNVGRNSFDLTQIKKDISSVIYQKENLLYIKYQKIRINQILLKDTRLIGIIKNGDRILDGTYFKLYITENDIEEEKGEIRVESVNVEKGIAQIAIYTSDSIDYWAGIAKTCCENGYHVLGDHRLEVIIPVGLENLNLEDLKALLSIYKKCG
jgi:hypothetical protein